MSINLGMQAFIDFFNDFLFKFKSEGDENSSFEPYLEQWRDNLEDIKQQSDILYSPWVLTLIDILCQNYTHDTSAIIFVAQRLTSHYLVKLLHQHPLVTDVIDKQVINCVFSHHKSNIFQKSYSIINPADIKYFDLGSLVTESRFINMSLKKQQSIINAFRMGECKILAATNVIEEGLDISNCNNVVIFDWSTI